MKIHFPTRPVLLIALTLFTSLNLNAQKRQQVQVFDLSTNSDFKTGEGGFYCLPQTKLSVEIVYTQKDFKRGDLFDCKWLTANKEKLKEYLNYDIVNLLKGIIQTSQFKLLDKDVLIKQSAVVDTGKIYFVQLNKKAFKSSNVKLVYGTEYLLNSATQENENKTFEMVTKIISSGISIASSILPKSLIGIMTLAEINDPTKKLDEKRDSLLSNLTKLENLEKNFMTGEKTVEDSSLLAGYLSNLKQLKKQILIRLGYDYEEKTLNSVFDIVPKKGENNYQLFTFSPETGITPLANAVAIGKRYYRIDNAGIQAVDSNMYVLKLDIENNPLAAFDSQPGDDTKRSCYRYNIPAKANVVITKNIGTYYVANSRLEIPQFGTIGYIKTTIAKNSFEVDGTTGALKSLSLQRNAAITSEKIDQANAVVEKINTAANREQKEIDKLKTEKERLQLIEDIRKLKEGTSVENEED